LIQADFCASFPKEFSIVISVGYPNSSVWIHPHPNWSLLSYE